MIHTEHPFVPDDSERDPVRRFRGRHGSGVAIVTAGTGAGATGLTVSSFVVLEGDPGRIAAVVGPLTELWDAIEATGRFVVHLCSARHREISDVFAGVRPSPGGMFARVDWSGSEWGPVLTDLPDRASCSVERTEEIGYTGLVLGTVDQVELSDLSDPLLYFRGSYRRLR